MNYELFCGDCLVEMNKIADGSIDAIICDLPYGTTQNPWDVVIPFDKLWNHYRRVIKPSGAIVLFGNQPFTSKLIMSNLEWFKYECVFDKILGVGFLDASKRPLRRHENIVVFCEGQSTYNPQKTKGKLHRNGAFVHNKADSPNYGSHKAIGITITDDYFPTSIIVMPKESQDSRLHPTQKPVALLEYLIRTYTNEGETVLDNCFGSCSTGVAAMRTKRRFKGIEQDAGYFAIGSKQIADAARAAANLPKILTGNPTDLSGLPMFSEVTA